MGKKVYRVLDTSTKLYWNGGVTGTPSFSKEGRIFPSKNSCARALTMYMRHGMYSHRTLTAPMRNVPATWDLEELELEPKPVGTTGLAGFSNSYRMRCELEKIDHSLVHFYDTMDRKGVADKIEFIFTLKGDKQRWGGSVVSKEKILEARAQLRLLGVKTRTFREYRGSFGMLNREQAMRARLTLDIERVVDLGKIRTELAAGVPVGVQHSVKI